MISTQKDERQELIEQAADYLEVNGYTDIKADCPGFETPKHFAGKGDANDFTPDLTAEKDGRRYYFELGTKTKNTDDLKTKWMLLDTMARMKKMGFKVITMRGHVQFTRNMFRELGFTPNRLIRYDVA